MNLRTFEICVLNKMNRSCSFTYCTRISMISSLKTDQNKIKSCNWYQHVINGRKMCQRWNMSCYSLITTNTWKIMIKTKNHQILSSGMEIIFMNKQCLKSYLKVVYNEDIDEGCFHEVNVQYFENLHYTS